MKVWIGEAQTKLTELDKTDVVGLKDHCEPMKKIVDDRVAGLTRLTLQSSGRRWAR